MFYIFILLFFIVMCGVGVTVYNSWVYNTQKGAIPPDNVYVHKVTLKKVTNPLTYENGVLVEDQFRECSIMYRDMNGNFETMTAPEEVFNVFAKVANIETDGKGSKSAIVKKSVKTTDFNIMVLQKINGRIEQIKTPSQEDALPAIAHLKTQAFENVLKTLNTLDYGKETVKISLKKSKHAA